MSGVPEAQYTEKCGWSRMNMGKVILEKVRRSNRGGKETDYFMI